MGKHGHGHHHHHHHHGGGGGHVTYSNGGGNGTGFIEGALIGSALSRGGNRSYNTTVINGAPGTYTYDEYGNPIGGYNTGTPVIYNTGAPVGYNTGTPVVYSTGTPVVYTRPQRVRKVHNGPSRCTRFGRFFFTPWTIGTCFILLYIIIFSVCYPRAMSPNTSLSLSETRPVGAFTTWYSEVDINAVTVKDPLNPRSVPPGLGKDVLLLKFPNGEPPLTQQDQWSSMETINIGGKDHYYWSWYLLPGSEVDFSWTYLYSMNFYLIKSVEGYNKYYNDAGDADHFYMVQKYGITGDTSYVVQEGDIYFVVLENWLFYSTAYGSASMTITSKLYDVSGATSNCSAPCSQSLSFSSDDFLVLYTPRVSSYNAKYNLSADTEFDFTMKYESVAWFVALLYVGPCGLMLIITIALSVCVCKKRRLARCHHPEQHAPSTLPQSANTPIMTTPTTNYSAISTANGGYTPLPTSEPTAAPPQQPYAPVNPPPPNTQQPYTPANGNAYTPANANAYPPASAPANVFPLPNAYTPVNANTNSYEAYSVNRLD